jgi:Integrase core domain
VVTKGYTFRRHYTGLCCQHTPLGLGGRARLLVCFATDEVTFLIEMVLYRGVNGAELLQRLHAPKPEHRTFSSPERLMRVALEEWRRDYNTVRPHSRIGWLAPAVYAVTFLPQTGQGAALIDGSAPWPAALPVHDVSNRQTLVATG